MNRFLRDKQASLRGLQTVSEEAQRMEVKNYYIHYKKEMT